MTNPKVSIVIPVFNGERTLKQCLNSVLNQTYKKYEVIVVDNNSTDKTREIINGFEQKDKRVKYLFELKRARGAARFRGEINSEGKIILMTDSDCIAPNNWIEEMTKPIADRQAIAVQGMLKPVIRNYWTMQIQKEKEQMVRDRLLDRKIGLLDTANFAIRKDILKEIGYSNPEIFSGNDNELMIRIKNHGYNILFKYTDVLHFHADTALKLFRKFFKRGEWNEKIANMNKTKESLFVSEGIIDYLFGLAGHLLTFNKDFAYCLVTGMAWRLGAVWAKIKNL